MKVQKSKIVYMGTLVGLIGLTLFGCSAKTTMSKEDQANFKGGPMPANFAAESGKRKAAAESKVPASYKAWTEHRNAALGKSVVNPPGAAAN